MSQSLDKKFSDFKRWKTVIQEMFGNVLALIVEEFRLLCNPIGIFCRVIGSVQAHQNSCDIILVQKRSSDEFKTNPGESLTARRAGVPVNYCKNQLGN